MATSFEKVHSSSAIVVVAEGTCTPTPPTMGHVAKNVYFLDDRGVKPIVAAAGQHRLAGGSLWSDMWHYEQRVTVLELSRVDQPDLPAFEDALIQAQVAAKNIFNDNHWEAGKFASCRSRNA